MDAEHGDDHGTMDITQHQKTWAGFVWLTKWSLAGILLIMALLALTRTHG